VTWTYRKETDESNEPKAIDTIIDGLDVAASNIYFLCLPVLVVRALWGGPSPY